jgi:hypothetical protein
MKSSQMFSMEPSMKQSQKKRSHHKSLLPSLARSIQGAKLEAFLQAKPEDFKNTNQMP